MDIRRPSLSALPFQARLIEGEEFYAIDFVGYIWSCRGNRGRGYSDHWRRLAPVFVQNRLAVRVPCPLRTLFIAELVLIHFGSPKPTADAIVRYHDNPANCAFDAICWDLPTDDEISEAIKNKLRSEINDTIRKYAFREQRMWHRRANKHVGISSQSADSVTVQELHAKLDYLKRYLTWTVSQTLTEGH